MANASNVKQTALDMFTAYVVANYPPGCVISDPSWHAPKLFGAASYAISRHGDHAIRSAVCDLLSAWDAQEEGAQVSVRVILAIDLLRNAVAP